MTSQSIIKEKDAVDDGVILRLQGEVDLTSSPQVRQTLLETVKNKDHSRVVIDLSDVSFMDSSGVATLVEALQAQRKAGGKLVLFGLQDRVRGIFEIARLDSIFTIVDDEQAATNA